MSGNTIIKIAAFFGAVYWDSQRERGCDSSDLDYSLVGTLTKDFIKILNKC